jgi:hypothetical protein
MKIKLQDSGEPDDSKRRLTRIKGGSKKVVLLGDSEQFDQGEVVDESFGGIGLRFNTELPFEAGQEIEVSYNGVQLWTIVRHVTIDDAGNSRVGLEWKANSFSRIARQTMPDSRDGQELAEFKKVLPSGFYMMWRLLECKKWLQLEEKADNLRRLASKCEFADTVASYVRVLQDAIKLAEPEEGIKRALYALIEECIRVTTGQDKQFTDTSENLA